MKLTEHFTWLEVARSQTATRLGIDNSLPDSLRQNVKRAAEGMERIRGILGWPITVDSWYRCPELNRRLNGAMSSEHLQGWAVDFVCLKFGSPKEICLQLLKHDLAFNQLIYEGTWVHVSFAPALRRQVLTAQFGGGKVRYLEGIV